MKILFLHKPYTIAPHGIAYLSSYLKYAGHEVDLCLVNGDEDPAILEPYDPDMLCYSVTTGMHVFYERLNRRLRREGDGLLSVFGGPHVTFFPEYAQREGVDIGVRGEGFETIVDIANAIEARESVEEIFNVVIVDMVNPLRPLLDKSTMLLPDRDLVYQFPEHYNKGMRDMICSFECPYGNCPYCFNPTYKEMYDVKHVQIRPVAAIEAEIQDLLRFPRLDHLYFQDDVFPVYNREWLAEFCRMYSKYHIPFHIHSRIEFITEDVIAQLREVELYGLTFAIEAGNEELRRNVLKRRMSDSRILKATNTLHKYGVKFRSENMVGIPGENMDTAMETVDLNIACKPTIGWMSLYQPYPGTPLGDLCSASGIFDGDLDGIDESFFDTYRLKSPDAAKFERLQKLFPLLVKYPRLRFLTALLIRLPLQKLYKRIYQSVKPWLYDELFNLG